jgi:hypothetical protein
MSRHETGFLRNVSLSGLSFKSRYHFQTGMRLSVHISLLNPLFKTSATVVWCHPSDLFYEVGIKFSDIDADFKKAMFEQICLIENYRIEISKAEGRFISSEQAAREWLSQMGKAIPC